MEVFFLSFLMCTANPTSPSDCAMITSPRWHMEEASCEQEYITNAMPWASGQGGEILQAGCVPVTLPIANGDPA
jgi:hypothetical protein